MGNKTFSPKADDIEHKWHIVDATDKVLGRMASQIAHVLKGKHKPLTLLTWIWGSHRCR